MQIGRMVRVHAGSGCLPADPNQALYTATLATNAGLNGRIRLPEAIAAGRTAQSRLRGIQIVSFDNLAWEVWLWATSSFQIAGGSSSEAFRGFWTFAATDGKQIAATGLWYYYIDGLDVFYEDDDAVTTVPPAPSNPDQAWRATSNGQTGAYLNVTLVNRSAGAKTASAWFDLVFCLEPTQGQ
jgi:hypothetical protein